MSFLLDVADPSIHFRARQCCNSTGSKPFSALESSKTSVVVAVTTASSISTGKPATTTAATIKHSLFSSASPSTNNATGTGTIPTNNMFSAMSRMIRTASSSSVSLYSSSVPPSLSSSVTVTPASSNPNTPEAAIVSDPFTATQRPSTIATSLSPWMMPSVCDDDQMNKLISFQL